MIIIDKKPNEIHENLIPTKINSRIVQYKVLYIHTLNTNIPYKWAACLATS